jgi:hypothetical protein
MTTTDEKSKTLHPEKAVRRFDVFAEYTRLEQLGKGEAEDVAKGYGIWLAKVVASRRFGAKSEASGKGKPSAHGHHEESRFRSVGDELQTDEVFDQDIVDRMGTLFYDRDFAPAIADAREQGKSYEDIRDAIRKDWKPAKPMGKSG